MIAQALSHYAIRINVLNVRVIQIAMTLLSNFVIPVKANAKLVYKIINAIVQHYQVVIITLLILSVRNALVIANVIM